jgi:hypothetical protein
MAVCEYLISPRLNVLGGPLYTPPPCFNLSCDTHAVQFKFFKSYDGICNFGAVEFRQKLMTNSMVGVGSTFQQGTPQPRISFSADMDFSFVFCRLCVMMYTL